MEVTPLDRVKVDNPYSADASRREICRRRCPQTSRADDQDAGSLQLPLPLESDLRHDDVSAVPSEFAAREGDAALLRYRAPRDGGDDHQGISLLQPSLFAVHRADVLFVEVDVDEIPQPSVLGVEVPAQVGVALGERLKRVLHRLRAQVQLVSVVCVLPEDGGNYHPDTR